jgi:3-phenylpropionate/cinnamic acid dioxygenase small subunit
MSRNEIDRDQKPGETSMTVTNERGPNLSADPGLRDVQFEIEHWLYAEAELLDDRRFAEWLALAADDIQYTIPLRVNRPRKDLGQPPAVQSAHMEDDKHGLSIRVKRLLTGLAWSEDPPGMSRRIVANVRVRNAEGAHEYAVRSNFLLYVSRLGSEEVLFAGERHDVLRRVADERAFELVRRRIMLDQSTLPAINFTVFF